MNRHSTTEITATDDPTSTTRRAIMKLTTTHTTERTSTHTNETVTIDG